MVFFNKWMKYLQLSMAAISKILKKFYRITEVKMQIKKMIENHLGFILVQFILFPLSPRQVWCFSQLFPDGYKTKMKMK